MQFFQKIYLFIFYFLNTTHTEFSTYLVRKMHQRQHCSLIQSWKRWSWFSGAAGWESSTKVQPKCWWILAAEFVYWNSILPVPVRGFFSFFTSPIGRWNSEKSGKKSHWDLYRLDSLSNNWVSLRTDRTLNRKPSNPIYVCYSEPLLTARHWLPILKHWLIDIFFSFSK